MEEVKIRKSSKHARAYVQKCAYCGEEFHARKGQLYCSKECITAVKRWNRRKRGVIYERILDN